ncbi:unnamed protein product [Phyllotreta striolata]|uniref:Uncharacterized protein n=1 Tax=Phyllotreta striolata TaxID=444603 RepID=A0A9N9XNM5_PHYSR|nr:unnamed protein product [Phyllotreta striolata]
MAFNFNSDLNKIHSLSSSLEELRQNERKELKILINEIRDNINSKKHFLKQNNTLLNIDLSQLKHDMISIQDSIQYLMDNTITKMKYLKNDFFDINQDVDYYIEKVNEWSQPIDINKINSKTNYKTPDSKVSCIEIREFIDFLHRSGGHENGWDPTDHQLFIKCRNKFKNPDTSARKLNELLPDKTIEEIKQHEEWYKEYLILENNKKEAIKKWQESKHKAISISKPPVQSKITITHEDLKEKLSKWKQNKDMIFQTQISTERENYLKKKELESKRKQKNEETKRIVEEWKRTKLFLEEQQKLRAEFQQENDRKLKAITANKLIKEFQTRDDLYILQMKNSKNQHQAQKPSRSKSTQLVPRDPERLFKPTRQWINRLHDDNIYPEQTPIPIKQLPKLGVPEWRRKID